MNKIQHCRLCKSKNIIKFLSLGNQPPANRLLKSLKKKEVFYPLSLSWCKNCSLVQLNETLKPKDLFSYYIWLTSTSKTAREQAKIFYQEIAARFPGSPKGYILEAASNDGTFLLPFKKAGFKVLGIDPAKNIAVIARKRGVLTKSAFFGTQTAKKILEKHGLAQVIIARNVVPHVASLHDFVKGLSLCLKEDGLLAVEFHYAKEILEGLQYDSIYHEHLCYFTLKSAESLFTKHGLFVVDVKTSPISGGALVLYLRKNEVKRTPAVEAFRKSEKKLKVNDLNSWRNFAKKVFSHRQKLLKILKDVVKKTGPIAAYGASARSSTLLNFCGIDGKIVSVIADQNPLKHGCFTPGIHIPISSPEKVMQQKPKAILILAWNFAEEITKILENKYGFKGKIILPFANDPKLIGIHR